MGLTLKRGVVQIGPHDFCLANRGTDREANIMSDAFSKAFPNRSTLIHDGHLYVESGYEFETIIRTLWEQWANAFRDGYLAGFNECQRIHGTRP